MGTLYLQYKNLIIVKMSYDYMEYVMNVFGNILSRQWQCI